MPSWVVKLADDEYVHWLTVVDAPISTICNREQAVKLWGDERVSRADLHVTSCIVHYFWESTPEDFVAFNHAGADGECLTLDEIRKQYAAK